MEKWLLQVEDVMISSLRKVILQSIESYRSTERDNWVLDWPGQVVICVSSIFWTMEVPEEIPKENGMAVGTLTVMIETQCDTHVTTSS